MSQLPYGWAKITVGETGQWGSGGTPKSKNSSYYGGTIPWIRSGDLPDGPINTHEITITEAGLQNSSTKWVPEGAVLIAMYGATIGKLGITTYPVTTNQAVAFCVPNEAVDPRFLFHGLFAKKQELIAMGQGGAQPNISQQLLKSVEFQLPPLPEQQRIVAKVEGLIARTARARRDLDRIPTLVARYKQRVLELASLGDLTKDWRESHDRVGWSEVSVEEIAETTFDGPFGSNLKSADYVAKGVRVVRLENIGRLTFIRDKETYISKKKYERLKRHTLEADDVLFSSFIAEEIRVCRFPESLPTAAINKADCFCVRPNADQCLPAFLTFRLASPQAYEVLKESVHGATRPRISLKQLKAFKFELPPIDEQQEIVRRIESAFGWLDRLTADHSAAERLLPKLDAAILEKAFQGELVPQDPDDEPVSVLLERIKAERAAAPKKKRARKSSVLTPPLEKKTMAKNLQEALTEAAGWISAQDAFQRCGIGHGATTEEIEALYAELRQLDKDGKLETEAVNDKQGRKLHDRLRLKAA